MKALAAEEDAFEAPLTPLIDIVFLLLIFFLVATSFTRKEVDQQVTLPTVGSGAAMTVAPGSLVINVRDDATLVINRRIVDVAELPAVVRAWKEGQPNGRVVLRSDGGVTYQQVMAVLGVCRAEGVEKIDLPLGAR